MRRLLFVLAALSLVVAGTVRAAPWFGNREVEADLAKEYAITPEVGEYVICAAAFSGPMASGLAHDLVLEIRKNYHEPAFIFNRGAEERRKQQEQIDVIRSHSPEGAHIRCIRIEDQFAVLVGGYKDMDSARKDLDRIKAYKPSTKFMSAVPVADAKTGQPLEVGYVSPFLQAFVSHNPTVPVQRQNPDELADPLLEKLNRGESYSLMHHCKKPWTLAVKSFQGLNQIEGQNSGSSFLDKIGLTGRSADVLNAGALQAHALAEVLRKMNPSFESYVLHTRNMSVVCVGSFDNMDDPQLRQTQMVLSRIHLGGPGGTPDMQMFAQPLPMKVPHP